MWIEAANGPFDLWARRDDHAIRIDRDRPHSRARQHAGHHARVLPWSRSFSRAGKFKILLGVGTVLGVALPAGRLVPRRFMTCC